MAVFSERVLTAKKEHRCNECGRFIQPGERYTRMFGQAESYEPAYEIKNCSWCKDPDEAKKPKSDGYDYIRTTYGCPVQLCQRVTVDGKEGTICRADDHQHYIHVKFADQRHAQVCHPTWRTVYYAEDGVTLLADYREKKEATA